MKNKMKILLVCEYIAPTQGIGAIRWTKITKYLKKNHRDKVMIDVLTNKKNYDNPESGDFYTSDALLEKEMQYFNHYFSVPVDDIVIRLKNRYKAIRKRNNGLGASKDGLHHTYKIIFFLKKLYRRYVSMRTTQILVRAIKSKAGEYDVIISSYPEIWTFMVCSKLKSKYSHLKWICDFRDICGRHTSPLLDYGKWHINYVQKHSRLADAVFHIDDFIDTHTDKRIKDYTVTNGYDPEEVANPKKPCWFDLIYTGTIYGNLQNFGVIYRTINELAQEGVVDLKKVRVLYAGKCGSLAQKMAKDHGGDKYFINLHEIPRYKAHELQQNAAILIQACFNVEGDHCAWTGKMYEYMRSQKPIVYIVNGNISHSFPSKYMELLGGICYEESRHEETYADLKAYILAKYKEWEETGNVTVVQDKNYIQKYSYERITEQVWEIMNSI
ncbi:hypothetical protein [Ileibacterium valens]|uniref:hypothetical protein n=1 Tax=Ileibacterium valens TaxID=1862668 RepID=UPI0020886013|nr:hypothetical protein [Ileibacterium valens]GJM57566.1 hypothetical protein EROP_12590 [Erysipelotrichaceae bacterium OPF54]